MKSLGSKLKMKSLGSKSRDYLGGAAVVLALGGCGGGGVDTQDVRHELSLVPFPDIATEQVVPVVEYLSSEEASRIKNVVVTV